MQFSFAFLSALSLALALASKQTSLTTTSTATIVTSPASPAGSSEPSLPHPTIGPILLHEVHYTSSSSSSTPSKLSPDSTITAFALPSGVSNYEELNEKWHVTTFWSCVTFPSTTHCGWHEPVLPGGDEIAGASTAGVAKGLILVGVAVVGVLLW